MSLVEPRDDSSAQILVSSTPSLSAPAAKVLNRRTRAGPAQEHALAMMEHAFVPNSLASHW